MTHRVTGALRVVVLLGLAAGLTGLTACREEERARPLSYEKGTYQGPADQEITPEQRRQLQQRGLKQQG